MLLPARLNAATPIARCALHTQTQTQTRWLSTSSILFSKAAQDDAPDHHPHRHLKSLKLRTGYESFLRAFGLEYLGPNVESGVEIDAHGRLRVISEFESRQKHRTALLLSRAPLSLTEKDFYGLLGKGRFFARWRSRGGLEKVIPWRHGDSLKRDNRWILLFSTPGDAAKYQERVLALRAFVRKHTPPTPISKPAPTPDLEAPDLPGFTYGDYTITPPFQAPAIYAFKHPFPRQLQEMIDTHSYFTSYTDTGAKKYAVRVWMDDKSPFLLNQYLIKEWLQRDAAKRHIRWELAEIDEPIQPLSDDPAGDLLAPVTSTPTNEVVIDYYRCHNWLVFFSSAGEARRFVRTFHRTPLPKFRGMPDAEPMPLVKAELMLENVTV